MPGPESRADRMKLLARVEVARETRCRAAVKAAEAAHADAAAAAEAATARAMEARRDRQTVLRQDYQAMLGLQSSLDIQTLRIVEQQMAARQHEAVAQQQDAERAAREAGVALDEAREALRLVSQRSLRRNRLADTLRRADALAAMTAEEEAVADELMDRVGAMPT